MMHLFQAVYSREAPAGKVLQGSFNKESRVRNLLWGISETHVGPQLHRTAATDTVTTRTTTIALVEAELQQSNFKII
jgi:hypothetical protein